MVRFANKDDLERVNEIRKQVNDLHVNGRPDIFRPGFCKEMQEYVYEMYQSGRWGIIVAERNGIICGMACVEYVAIEESLYGVARKYYNIHEFAVDECFKRQGIGTELFNFIKQDAKEKGVPVIQLAVWCFNEEAVRFYEAQDFNLYRMCMEYKL